MLQYLLNAASLFFEGLSVAKLLCHAFVLLHPMFAAAAIEYTEIVEELALPLVKFKTK
jgi:hypothetical protein